MSIGRIISYAKKVTWLDAFGMLAFLASAIIAIVGLPAQIHRSYSLGTSIGFDPILGHSLVAVYFFWAIYAWLKKDWYLFWANVPGCVFAPVLVFQYWYYP